VLGTKGRLLEALMEEKAKERSNAPCDGTYVNEINRVLAAVQRIAISTFQQRPVAP
jgi:hypothetical protein